MFKIEDVAMRGQTSRSTSKTVIFVHPQGETVLDHLLNRRDRPYTAFRKEVLPALFTRLGLAQDTKVRWSSRAGCSCPCSPGFIIEDNGVNGHQLYRQDVHVTVS
jgi:hypothetical protein